MPARPAAHGWKMMTTGQAASQATWPLTEPTASSPSRHHPNGIKSEAASLLVVQERQLAGPADGLVS